MKQFYQKYKYWLKWIFSIALLIVVFYKVDVSMVINNFKLVPWWYYLVCILLVFLFQIISTLRWKLFLKSQSFFKLLKINLIALYYSYVLPSSITGDIAKVINLKNNGTKNHKIIAGVIIDKLIGFFTLSLLLLITVYYTKTNSLKIFENPVFISSASLLIGILILKTSLVKSTFSFLYNFKFVYKFIGTEKYKFILNLIDDLHFFLNNKKILFYVFILSLFFQIIAASSYYLLNYVFNFNVNYSDYVIVSGLIQISSLLPLSMGGIGIKDVTFVTILSLINVDKEKALAASLISYPVVFFFIILGFYLNYRSNLSFKVQN